jgi:diaminopimelate epimerase
LAEDGALVARLCNRHRGVGADGALALFRRAADRVALVYRNADGGLASFCANGTRCAARAAVELLACAPELAIETQWVAIPARVSGSEVRLDLPAITGAVGLEVVVAGATRTARLLTVGVPHLVLWVEDLNGLDLAALAPPLRHDSRLGDDGANIDFVAPTVSGIRLRSFERGVEDETLCCGSGVVAAGLLELARRGGRKVEVEARSGDVLLVEAAGEAFGGAVSLTGPTRFIAVLEPQPELIEVGDQPTR